MAGLLDLTNEILEMVLRRVVKDIGPTISSPADVYKKNIAVLAKVLPLRLVHSRFRDLADPFIFKSVACQISHDRQPRDAGARKWGVYELMGTCPAIGGHVQSIYLQPEHAQGTRQSPRMVERLQKLLRYSHTKVARLSLETFPGGDPSPTPFYHDIFAQTFPSLRELRLDDVAFAFSFPQIANAAPLLEHAQLCGESDLSYDAVQTLVTAMRLPRLKAKGTITNPIKYLRLLDFGQEWLACLLANVRPYAEDVETNAHREMWPASGSQLVGCLKHLGDCGAFTSFEMLHFDIWDEPWDGESAAEIIESYVALSAPQREDLFVQLKTEWAGKGIGMYMLRPDREWEQYADEDTRLKHILEEHWEET